MGCKKTSLPNPVDLKLISGEKYSGGIFRVNEVGELRSLDPVQVNDVTSAHISENIYDQLLYFNEKLELTNELAESREISPEGTLYTYHIRKGVYFHDNPCFLNGKGRLLTAYDVLYSFQRVCDARSGTLGSEYFRGKVEGAKEFYEATSRVVEFPNEQLRVSNVRGFVAVDSFTFTIKLVKPFGPFEYYAALNNTGIHPKEAVEYYGKNYFQNPVGSGPFRFVRWSPDQECILTRNNSYWKRDEFGNQLPYLSGIRFSFVKDDKMQLLEFREGALDESYRIPNEFFADIVDTNRQLRDAYKKYILYQVPALSTQYYGMLTIAPPFNSVEVRKAFSYAIDRERIMRFVLHGQAGEAGNHGLVPPIPGYNRNAVNGYEFNLTKARQLFAQAGYKGGKGFPPITLQLNSGGGRNSSIAESIQTMLKDNLGVDCSIKMVEFARHLEETEKARAPFFRLGWVADYPDPETFLNLWYGASVPEKTETPSPQNTTRYKNVQFDEIFEKAISTPDRQRRFALYEQAENIAMKDAPMIIIFHDQDYRLVQPYVKGYRNNSMDKRPYVYVWFDKTIIENSRK